MRGVLTLNTFCDTQGTCARLIYCFHLTAFFLLVRRAWSPSYLHCSYIETYKIKPFTFFFKKKKIVSLGPFSRLKTKHDVLCNIVWCVFWKKIPKGAIRSEKLQPALISNIRSYTTKSAFETGRLGKILKAAKISGKILICQCYQSNSLKPVVRPSVRPSVGPSVCPSLRQIHLWVRRALQPSAGARKKPPVGGLNFRVIIMFPLKW